MFTKALDVRSTARANNPRVGNINTRPNISRKLHFENVDRFLWARNESKKSLCVNSYVATIAEFCHTLRALHKSTKMGIRKYPLNQLLHNNFNHRSNLEAATARAHV